MDVHRAKELLTVLADGVDPLTGEVLPDNHVCNKGEIVRALHCAVEELSRRRKKNAARKQRKTLDRGTGRRAMLLVRRRYEKERPLYALWPHLRRDRVPIGAAGKAVKMQHKCRPTGDQTLLRMRYNMSVIKRRRAFL